MEKRRETIRNLREKYPELIISDNGQLEGVNYYKVDWSGDYEELQELGWFINKSTASSIEMMRWDENDNLLDDDIFITMDRAEVYANDEKEHQEAAEKFRARVETYAKSVHSMFLVELRRQTEVK